MRSLLMLILSTVTAAFLVGTLIVFFTRLRQIEDEFWGREKRRVREEGTPDEPAADTSEADGDTAP